MPRIRSLKPECFQDEKLARLDPIHRLVFIGLISQADDEGRLTNSCRLLDGLLFPFTKHTCSKSLQVLEEIGVVKTGNGTIQLVNWTKHQKVQHPRPSVLAPASNGSHESNMRVSGGSHETLTPDQDQEGDIDPDQIHALCRAIFEFWVETFDKDARTQYTEDRRNKIRHRLQRDCSEEDIRQSILGYRHDPWDRTKDLSRHDLTLICRNRGKIEKGLQLYAAWKAGDLEPPAGPQKRPGRYSCVSCNEKLSFEKSLDRGYCGPCWRNAGGND